MSDITRPHAPIPWLLAGCLFWGAVVLGAVSLWRQPSFPATAVETPASPVHCAGKEPVVGEWWGWKKPARQDPWAQEATVQPEARYKVLDVKEGWVKYAYSWDLRDIQVEPLDRWRRWNVCVK